MNLPAELQQVQRRIRDVARRHGLDFFETVFEMVDADGINALAAYGGFPTRYPHWRHGMEYEQLAKGYRFGLHKIYELVINNDPCYAYLLSSNSLVDNKLVIAHVYGHGDFFKNNAWFSGTDRKMMDRMANHAARVRRLMDRHGQECIEEFLDRATSLDNLVDLHGRLRGPPPRPVRSEIADEAEPEARSYRLRSKAYMDEFINPPRLVEERRRRAAAEEERERRLPGGPRRDLLGFLLEAAPLERWEQELLDIVHQEALYFAPQRATKIMNEGWASYWHRRIMVEDILTDEEIIDYADVVAGTLAEGRTLNPYKLGLELFLDIEERWNTGRHGPEYERCDDRAARDAWDTKEGRGREQIFLCRRVHNDVSFLDAYLTEEFCHRHQLFVYRVNPRSGKREIVTRDFNAVKERLLRQLANGGAPVIEVVDKDLGQRGELLLDHKWDGHDLRADWAEAALLNVARMWRRPVHLDTCRDDKRVRLTCDGAETRVTELGAAPDARDF
jgi:stage V sporulation protein R